MGGKKPKKARAPKVVKQDVAGDKAKADAEAARVANEEAAATRRSKAKMMAMRSGRRSRSGGDSGSAGKTKLGQ